MGGLLLHHGKEFLIVEVAAVDDLLCGFLVSVVEALCSSPEGVLDLPIQLLVVKPGVLFEFLFLLVFAKVRQPCPSLKDLTYGRVIIILAFFFIFVLSISSLV